MYDWLSKFKKTGSYNSQQGVNCGVKPRFTDKEAVLNFLKDNSDADGIVIRDAVTPTLPMSTFYGTLHRMEITFKKEPKYKERREAERKEFIKQISVVEHRNTICIENPLQIKL